MRCLSAIGEARSGTCIVLAFFGVLAFSIPFGCEGSVSPAPEVTIVPYEGVDGVTFGDSEATVIAKLGRPDNTGVGDFPGVFYEYVRGIHATMNVVIYSPGQPHAGVVSISVQSPYSGKTKEGIGVGSPRVSVQQTMGKADSRGVRDSTSSWERYNDDSHLLLVNYRGEVVESITLGIRL